MRTVALTLHVEDDLQEYLIADLLEMDFDAFEQGDEWLKAYIQAPRWDDAKREQIEQWLQRHDIDEPIEEHLVNEQNWNEQWEETVQPVAVGRFLIKPTWSNVPPQYRDRILLEVDPKMSFGTGYHESTRLILRLLPTLVDSGEHVLDAGTGTGILAIAAVKLGAASALAFDTDRWAQQNAVENFYLNEVQDKITFRAGSMEVVDEEAFDVVLANINRNVLLEMMPSFAQITRSGAQVVLSGLLRADREAILESAANQHLHPVREAEEGDWWAVVLEQR